MITFLFQTAGYRFFRYPFTLLFLPTLFCVPLTVSAGDALTLTCPENLTVQAPPNGCGIFLDYDSLAWDSSVPLSDTLFEPGPGHFFEFGTTTVTLTAIGVAGDTATCTFEVTVNSAGVFTLTCNNQLPVYLDETCEREVTAAMLLQSGPVGCPSQYVVIVLGPTGQNLGTVVNLSHVGPAWTVKVTDQLTGQSCWGQINVKTDSLPPSITCPPDLLIYCHEPPDPSFTGFPTATGCFDFEELDIEYFEMLTHTFCGADSIAFQIQRTWQSTDPYDNVTTCPQLIQARKLALDEIVFPPHYDGSEMPPLVCSDSEGPAALADTSLTGVPMANGLRLLPSNLACQLAVLFSDEVENTCGAHFTIQRTWTVFNFCDDTSISHVQTIVVEDVQAPVFTLPDTLWANVGAECGMETALPPIGLLHECSDFEVQITTPWDTLTTNGGTVDVPKEPGAFHIFYQVTDACGNVSADSLTLVVEDGIFSSCPPDVEINCHFYLNNLADSLAGGDFAVLQQFGLPTFFANCPFDVEESALVEVDTCSGGVIHRTMNIPAAGGGYSCQQDITVHHVSDWVIEFPADITITCTETPFDAGEPVVTGEDCERTGIWYTDEVFAVVPDACFKILRTWHAANYCVTGDTLLNAVVEKAENQLGLPFPDCDLDGDGDCDKRTFRDSWTNASMPGADQAANHPWDGYITYQQVIKINDQVKPVFPNGCDVPDVCIEGDTCNATVELPVPIAEDCVDPLVTAQIKVGNIWVNGFGPHQGLSPGTYEVRYNAKDNCNNQRNCNTTVTVKDCEPPVAVCKTSLVIELSSFTLTANLHATDLNGGSLDNCTSQAQLKRSFSPDINNGSVELTCTDLGDHIFQLWVTDQAGNQDFCEITVSVVDNFGSCVSLGGIGGQLITEAGIPAVNSEVHFSDSSITLVNINGYYQHPSPQISPITISPYRNDYHLNGVTTFDGVLLTRHILNLEVLDSPYKIIAADVNKSGTVTTFDAVEIRKLVLGQTFQFPNNTSWRFVPADYVFPDPNNPFQPPFPESITTDLPPSEPGGFDFIAIKTGDLNGSAFPLTGSPDDRNAPAGTLQFNLPARPLKKGETITVPFLPGPMPLFGFQFALAFDPGQLELLDIQPGLADSKSFGTHRLNEGLLKTSWFSGTAVTPGPGLPVFSLVFKALADTGPDHWLRLDQQAMVAEAYTAGLETLDIGLVFENAFEGSSSFLQFPARPNPFRESTAIGFQLPQAGVVTLVITDLAGRQVKRLAGHFGAGYGMFEVKREELGPAGLFLYQLRSEHGSGGGKLVVSDW